MSTCNAAGCKILTKRFMCGPHQRMIGVAIRRRLRYGGKPVRMAAIRAVAEKEGKLKLYEELEMAEDRN